jgi:hypothetical protein
MCGSDFLWHLALEPMTVPEFGFDAIPHGEFCAGSKQRSFGDALGHCQIDPWFSFFFPPEPLPSEPQSSVKTGKV